jgi:hypothetical protein
VVGTLLPVCQLSSIPEVREGDAIGEFKVKRSVDDALVNRLRGTIVINQKLVFLVPQSTKLCQLEIEVKMFHIVALQLNDIH